MQWDYSDILAWWMQGPMDEALPADSVEHQGLFIVREQDEVTN